MTVNNKAVKGCVVVPALLMPRHYHCKILTDPSEAARLVDEGFIPMISEMPGFVAYYCVDAGDGVMDSISIFEHQAAEEQSSWRAGQFVAQHIAPLSPNPPQVTAGDVVVAHKSS